MNKVFKGLCVCLTCMCVFGILGSVNANAEVTGIKLPTSYYKNGFEYGGRNVTRAYISTFVPTGYSSKVNGKKTYWSKSWCKVTLLGEETLGDYTKKDYAERDYHKVSGVYQDVYYANVNLANINSYDANTYYGIK